MPQFDILAGSPNARTRGSNPSIPAFNYTQTPLASSPVLLWGYGIGLRSGFADY